MKFSLLSDPRIIDLTAKCFSMKITVGNDEENIQNVQNLNWIKKIFLDNFSSGLVTIEWIKKSIFYLSWLMDFDNFQNNENFRFLLLYLNKLTFLQTTLHYVSAWLGADQTGCCAPWHCPPTFEHYTQTDNQEARGYPIYQWLFHTRPNRFLHLFCVRPIRFVRTPRSTYRQTNISF